MTEMTKSLLSTGPVSGFTATTICLASEGSLERPHFSVLLMD